MYIELLKKNVSIRYECLLWKIMYFLDFVYFLPNEI